MELFAIAALTYEEMTEVDRKRLDKNRSDVCYFTFPVSLSFLPKVL
jgi:hypothetical protein